MADRRTLVSYDDLTAPRYVAPAQLGPPLPSTHQPPAKRRRTHQKAPPRRTNQHVQHWDDPGSNAPEVGYGNGVDVDGEYAAEEEEEEESRELTHEEIWDDSALIDAWNSATAEYEVYHGKTKKWKEEPVKKSPLWYNVPPSPSKLNGKGKAKDLSEAPVARDAEEDSKPLDFNTYIPTHDPSLAAAQGTAEAVDAMADYDESFIPGPAGAMANQDEAFQKALTASYWSGYWTAVYFYHRQTQNQSVQGRAPAEDAEEEEVEEVVGEDDAAVDDLIDTQR